MEGLVGFGFIVSLVLFVLTIVVLVEFLAIGWRVGDIKAQLREVRKESQDQTRYLAAISRNLALLVGAKIPSEWGHAPGTDSNAP